MVPVIAPVPLLIPNPVGRPLAEYDKVSPSGSDALIASEAVAPVREFCVPGFVTVGAPFAAIVHMNCTLEMLPDVSVTRAVTSELPLPAVIVPLIRPVVELIVRPAGRFVAL